MRDDENIQEAEVYTLNFQDGPHSSSWIFPVSDTFCQVSHYIWFIFIVIYSQTSYTERVLT